MLALTIISIFILIVILLIFFEYRNAKKYKETRRKKRQIQNSTERSEASQEAKKATPEPAVKVKPEPKLQQQVVEPEPQKEVPTETKELPEANYPQFTHVRLIEMGLSDEEAKEFVAELIPQIETEIPLIKAAIQEGDFHKIEKLTHGIKGSATNLGTGGVSDLLTDYNTYLKTGIDVDIVKAYLKHLVHYTNELKAQYA